MEISNKVAIVTGGRKGIGFAIVEHLLRYEAQYVAFFDLPPPDDVTVIDSLKKLQAKFKEGTFGYYRCDVTNKSELIVLFKDCYEKVAKLKNYVDIFINNAGIISTDVSKLISVNFKAVVNSTLIAIERMGKHKGHKGGTILSIGSIVGLFPAYVIPTYSATKAAVICFVRAMKAHDEKFGIRNICLCPNITTTDLIKYENCKKNSYDFIDLEKMQNMLSVPKQKSESVAAAVIKLITGKNDDPVWVVQNDKEAIIMESETDLKKLCIPF